MIAELLLIGKHLMDSEPNRFSFFQRKRSTTKSTPIQLGKPVPLNLTLPVPIPKLDPVKVAQDFMTGAEGMQPESIKDKLKGGRL